MSRGARAWAIPTASLFVVTFPKLLDPVTALLQLQLGLRNRQRRNRPDRLRLSPPTPVRRPSYLTDKTPTSYYGTTVWHGYVAQPATQLIRNDAAHSTYQRGWSWSDGGRD